MKKFKNVRKIVVGDDFKNSIRYVKGSKYNLGKTQAELSDILLDEENPNFINLFVFDSQNECSIFWKSIKTEKIIEFENDVNFD